MKVQEVISLKEYDRCAPSEWPHRVPDVKSLDLAERLGDCIYDYSGGRPKQRPSVHGPANKKTDLGGKNALISVDFYYFGNRAIPLPNDLLPICPTTQGHRSRMNEPYRRTFEAWLRGLGLAPGQLYGWPDAVVDWNALAACGGCLERASDDEGDEDDG